MTITVVIIRFLGRVRGLHCSRSETVETPAPGEGKSRMPRRRSLLIASSVLTLLLGGVCVGTATAATGTDLYVDVTAADCSNTGPGTPDEPFCQIQPAADAAEAGDTVHITPSNTMHYAAVRIASSGTADAPITFTSTVSTRSPGVEIAGVSSDTPGLTLTGAQYIDINGLNVFPTGESNAVTITDSQHISYDHSSISDSKAPVGTSTPAISVDGTSSDISLTRLLIADTHGPGVATATGARDITIADDVFSSHQGAAVSATGTTGIDLAGDDIADDCGGVGFTDGTSGSIENTVISKWSTTPCQLPGTPVGISVDATSAAGVTSDYNAVNPTPSGVDYDWAGTAYTTAAAFKAVTAQGAHDLDQSDLTFSATGIPQDHTALIDSADADAPGELATDSNGSPRVDDPLVSNTGTGAGSGPGDDDRGAYELQAPLSMTLYGVTPTQVSALVPTTFHATVSNPWSVPLLYTFSFGDGTTATSTTGSVSHTYAAQPDDAAATYDTSVTVTAGQGDAHTLDGLILTVNPVPAITSTITAGTTPAAPDSASISFDTQSPYPVTSDQVSFGDTSAPVALNGSTGTLTHTFAAPGTYTVTQTVTDSDARVTTVTKPVTVGAAFVPMSPVRVLDTRDGTGAPRKPAGPGGVVRVKVTGVHGIPATGVTAVTMNLTDADATAAGYVTAYADGTSRPTASNLNFVAGQINPNLVTVPVGQDGYVDLYNSLGHVDLIADVQGYYTTTPAGAGHSTLATFAGFAPVRVLDTRNGTGNAKGPFGPGAVEFILPNAGWVATAAVLNVTVTGGSTSGYVTAECGSGPLPTASSLNYRAHQTTSNLLVVPNCAGGVVALYHNAGTLNVIADLQGYYTTQPTATAADGSTVTADPYVAVAPTRILDTRHNIGAAKPLGANSTIAVKVAGVDGIPVGTHAVLVNLTGTGSSKATWLNAFGGGAVPATSDIDLSPGETRPVLATVPVNADGYIYIHNNTGSIDVIADLEGYFG